MILIKTNFHDHNSITESGDFDVGYMIRTEIIRVRSEEDLKEMWGEVKRSPFTALWRDGLLHDDSCK